MKHIARYVVTDRKTGEVVARGNSDDCARRMGVSYGSFLTMASRAKRGIGKYEVERLDDMPRKKACARNWDAAFGWYRSSKEKYPCDGCMRRASCDFSGTYCSRWTAWFRDAYDAAVTVLKARGGSG